MCGAHGYTWGDLKQALGSLASEKGTPDPSRATLKDRADYSKSMFRDSIGKRRKELNAIREARAKHGAGMKGHSEAKARGARQASVEDKLTKLSIRKTRRGRKET